MVFLLFGRVFFRHAAYSFHKKKWGFFSPSDVLLLMYMLIGFIQQSDKLLFVEMPPRAIRYDGL